MTTLAFRLGGIAAILGSILLAVGWISAYALGDSTAVIVRWMGLFAFILIQFGLTALYAYQVEETGIWGLVGYVFAFAATAVFIGFTVGAEQTAIPEPILGPPAGISYALGFLLLGITSWKARKLPRSSAILWTVGVFVYEGGVAALNTPIAIAGAIVFAFAFSWAGITLVASANRPPT